MITFILNAFILIVRAIFLFSTTFINININIKFYFYIANFFVIKRLKKFKKRVKFKLKIIIRNILFK